MGKKLEMTKGKKLMAGWQRVDGLSPSVAVANLRPHKQPVQTVFITDVHQLVSLFGVVPNGNKPECLSEKDK